MKRETRALGNSLPLAISDPRGTGTPILFVHGFSHNRSVWSVLSEALPERWRPIAVDLRGHGDSPWSPEGAYHLRDYALDLRVVLDSLAISEAHLVGHSLGGNVCTLFAADAAYRIRSLTLVDTGPSLAVPGSTQITSEVGAGLRSYASVAEFRGQLALIHPQGDPLVLDRLAAASVARRLDGRYEWALDPGVLGEGPGEGQGAVNMLAIERSLWSALGQLHCPVLVIRGEASSILSAKIADEMVDETLANGRLVTLPQAGHAVMIDARDALRSCLVDFLESVDPGKPRL